MTDFLGSDCKGKSVLRAGMIGGVAGVVFSFERIDVKGGGRGGGVGEPQVLRLRLSR